MKNFQFSGQMSGLIWSVVKTLSIMIGAIVLASIVPMMVQHWLAYFFLGIVAVTVTVAAVPSIVNTIIKYLVNNTRIDDKKLTYAGSVTNILAIIVISIVIWAIITAVLSILIAIIYAVFSDYKATISLLAVVFFALYALGLAFLYAWFVIRMYTMVIQNIQVEK